MKRTLWILLALAGATALPLAAQGPGRTAVGASLGVLPVFTAGASVSRFLVPHLAVRADLAVHRHFTYSGRYVAPCPVSGGCAPAPPAPFDADLAQSFAVGLELYTANQPRGFYALGLVGVHHLVDLETDSSRVAPGWQLGAGLLLPVGPVAMVLEVRCVQYIGAAIE